MDDTFDLEKFQQIKTRAAVIIAAQSAVKTMFKELADMYWISETDAASGNSQSSIRYNQSAYGDDDIRLTATTSSRDQVTGLHRLLRTTKPKFSVKCSNKVYADKIEDALDKWWEASNSRKRATVESELSLSGVLWSDENLAVTAIDDLLAQPNLPRVRTTRLTELRKRTPILFEVNSALIAYPVWGEDGMSEYLTVTSLKGRTIKERWGDDPNLKDDYDYTLYDYYDIEWVCTWIESQPQPKRMGKHLLPDLPRFSATADGTDLFPEEYRKRQPFLYGKWKSGLHKREDEGLTSLFSSVYSRGHGPLIVLDKSQPNYNPNDIELLHQGMIRILAAPGRPQLADDKAFDNNLINLWQMMKQWGEQTTIPSQTLGENIASGTPYSGYAMASQNGRIPIIPIQEATEKVIHDAAIYALRYFKEQAMEWEGLRPDEILDDFELTVKLEVDLPQDSFRNAQVVTQLKQAQIPISNEWIHNFLQIKDSKKMTTDTMSEQAALAAFQQDLPQLIQEMMQVLSGPTNPPAAPPTGPTGPVPPGAPSETAMQYPTTPGGPAATMAGGEVTPATEPQAANAPRGRA